MADEELQQQESADVMFFGSTAGGSPSAELSADCRPKLEKVVRPARLVHRFAER